MMSLRFICSGVMRGSSISERASTECVLDREDVSAVVSAETGAWGVLER